MCSSDVVRGAGGGGEGIARPDGGARPGVPLNETAIRGRSRVMDLTHVVTPDFPVFPGEPAFSSRETRTLEEHGYSLLELRFAEHTGTHLDAPAHFFADGETAERIAVDRLVAPLVVVCIAERASRDHDATLEVDDLLAWESRHGRIPVGAVVAMHSGWESRLADPARYLNRDDSGVMHAPGFGGEAAELLVRERGVAGVATDTLSLDIGASTSFPAHRAVLGAGRYGLENVACLGRVPPAGATLIVGGPKHAGATGGPARLLALF